MCDLEGIYFLYFLMQMITGYRGHGQTILPVPEINLKKACILLILTQTNEWVKPGFESRTTDWKGLRTTGWLGIVNKVMSHINGLTIN